MASQTQPSTALPHAWPAVWLAWLSQQLLLVPEAALLLALLCLHATLGPSPALVAAGMGIVGWFATRVSLLYSARRAVESAQYERAVKLAQGALMLYPLSADAHALLGTIYLARGNTTTATAALAKAVRYYPLQAGLHAALSAALLEDERPHDALIEASIALHLDPTCAPAYLHQASAEDLLDISPEQIERHIRAGLDQPAAAADEAALRCALARILLRRGNITEALQALMQAELLLPTSPISYRAGLHYLSGAILHHIGDTNAAHKHFTASESLDPTGPYAADAWRASRL
ncbi:MAG: hypothetical protein HGA19_20695 [Oscillochloris sp.]|nr:hypothetical protein [Oscillochloris sp.]